MDKAIPGGSGSEGSRERKSARVPLRAEVQLRRSGQTLTPEEMTALYARHDQVMLDV